MIIQPLSDRPSTRANPDYFSGVAWIEPLAATTTDPRLRVLRVTFEPGARTAWHTHPFGQVLHILSGIGRVQSDGGPVRTVNPGDTVVFAPGESHWHGAAPGHQMVHLAVQNGDASAADVTWIEKVTDAEYEGQ
jgi:quercetin dioxygenase-like cupin family protein